MFSRHARAAAVRYAAVLFVLYIAGAWVYLARGQLPPIAKLPDHMPKAQLAFVEKIDAHNMLHRQARQATGINQRELREKLDASRESLAADMTRDLIAGRIQKWAVIVTDIGPSCVTLSVPDRLDFIVDYDGMPEAARVTARKMTKGDILLLSAHTKLKPEVHIPSGGRGVLTTVTVGVHGREVTSLSKP
jgi:hypothetical protein